MSTPGSLRLILPYLGPQLAALLADSTVTELMVNADRSVWVERLGCVERVGVDVNPALLRVAIENIATTCGSNISEKDPILSARLEDGSRVAAVFPPASVGGYALSIRRFPRRYSLGELLTNGTVTEADVDTLQHAVDAHINILIAGGPGAGKTTLLNAIASEMFSPHDRVIVIEDTAEIALTLPHVVRLEARPQSRVDPSVLAVTISDLVHTALRLRGDRLIVGEVRGAEAFALLQALNTGHAGSLTTLHANSPLLALMKFAHYVMEGQRDLPYDLVRESIGCVVGIVAQVTRHRSGHIQLTSITNVKGFDLTTHQFHTEHTSAKVSAR